MRTQSPFRAARCRRVALIVAALVATAPASGQQSSSAGPTRPIQDNSFLIEEAYNQDVRVVQHISGMIYQPATRTWSYAFTQEWPAGGLLHQLSYTVVLDGAPRTLGGNGFGDAMLNYRYQLLGDGDSRVAIAPRATLIVPSGSATLGTGRGAPGYQFNLPVSVLLGAQFVTHLNAGFTVTPHAPAVDRSRATLYDAALGQSLIWLARPRFNVMLEGLWSRTDAVRPGGAVSPTQSVLLSPGVRGAFNFASGLQVVPGLAVPFELVAAPRRASLYGYLSFEHPF